jgi:hypothetical protein
MRHRETRAETSKIHVHIVIQRGFTFDPGLLTGRQTKERTGIPSDFTLDRRTKGASRSAQATCDQTLIFRRFRVLCG